jgi:hypothetical protein
MKNKWNKSQFIFKFMYILALVDINMYTNNVFHWIECGGNR